MQKMVWTATLYGTGEPTVDKQHQELFDLINNVLESMNKKESNATVGSQLTKLANFAKMHFTCEEGIMEKKKCSTCDINKKAHHQFLAEFTNILNEFSKTGATTLFEDKFTKFVSNWLRSHIMTIDTRIQESAQA